MCKYQVEYKIDSRACTYLCFNVSMHSYLRFVTCLCTLNWQLNTGSHSPVSCDFGWFSEPVRCYKHLRSYHDSACLFSGLNFLVLPPQNTSLLAAGIQPHLCIVFSWRNDLLCNSWIKSMDLEASTINFYSLLVMTLPRNLFHLSFHTWSKYVIW